MILIIGKKSYPNQPWDDNAVKQILLKTYQEKVKNFMMNHYNQKMIISAADKINHDKFVDSIKKLCTNLPSGLGILELKQIICLENIEKIKLEQIHLLLGFEGLIIIMMTSPLLVYSSLLDGGMSSRLFQEIRKTRTCL